MKWQEQRGLPLGLGVMEMFNSVGLDADLETATALKEADRVRAGITPEGNIGVDVVEED